MHADVIARRVGWSGDRLAKNIVACCDGTGNQIGRNISNVLKLFRICVKDETQRVYYGSGIGTIGSSDEWTRFKQDTKAVFSLATGYGLDRDILGAYGHVSRHYEPGDAIYLFGFSRGAYTARAVAGMIHLIGLLPPDQLNIANYGLRAYKRASRDRKADEAYNFGRIAGTIHPPIRFVGVWDTVASIIVPRDDRIAPQLLTLRHTRTNPSVEVFRHAMAIDERRRMFRLNRWVQDQKYEANHFDKEAPTIKQDVRQVWFAGVHSDVGGGYPERESQLSKYPLNWMIDQAAAKGLKIHGYLQDYLASGKTPPDLPPIYVAPDAKGKPHDSMKPGWQPLEWIPKSVKWREWPNRLGALGYYLPRSEPRTIAQETGKPLIHQSVLDHRDIDSRYCPENFPAEFDVEPLSRE